MLETESQIFQLLKRQICCLQRRDTVRLPSRQELGTDSDNIIDLVTYCVRENVPFTEFESWFSILATVKDIVAGKTTVKQVSAQGVEDFKKGVEVKH
jgi:hypothetical protein